MKKVFSAIRVGAKRLLSRWTLVPSYCKSCGCSVVDFHVRDEVWAALPPRWHGRVLCISCFQTFMVAAGWRGRAFTITFTGDK